MEFTTLTKQDAEVVRGWRNEVLESLRTPFALTEEQQEEFYKNIVCNRNARARYFGLKHNNLLIGMVGLENIEWENGIAEISIILDPGQRGKNLGSEAIEMLFERGFNDMRLNLIYGECYECNEAKGFWKKIIEKHRMFNTELPERKYYNGKYYSSVYFSLDTLGYSISKNRRKMEIEHNKKDGVKYE